MKNTTVSALAFVLAAILAGCGAGRLPAGTNMSVKPSSVQSCNPPGTVKVYWDFTTSHPQATAVEIWVGAGEEPMLFAAGAAAGNAKTGAWVRPGLVFHARDAASGEEIGQVAIEGPDCTTE